MVGVGELQHVNGDVKGRITTSEKRCSGRKNTDSPGIRGLQVAHFMIVRSTRGVTGRKGSNGVWREGALGQCCRGGASSFGEINALCGGELCCDKPESPIVWRLSDPKCTFWEPVCRAIATSSDHPKTAVQLAARQLLLPPPDWASSTLGMQRNPAGTAG